MRHERCTMRNARAVAKTAKYRSSQAAIDRFIAETASKKTRSSNTGKQVIKLLFFIFFHSSFLFLSPFLQLHKLFKYSNTFSLIKECVVIHGTSLSSRKSAGTLRPCSANTTNTSLFNKAKTAAPCHTKPDVLSKEFRKPQADELS